MSVELESAKRLTALKNKIDAKTETPSNTLSESVDNIIAGYGQGGGDSENIVMNDMRSFFRDGARMDLIDKVDGSSATNWGNCFAGNTTITEFPKNLDTSNGSQLNAICQNCTKLVSAKLNIKFANNLGYAFSGCTVLETLELDLGNKPSSTVSFLYNCKALKNLWFFNIYRSIQIASGTTYGHLLTVESLVHTIKELCKASNQTLTIGAANIEKIANLYCKVIDFENEKMPFELCESTDEGAMPLTEYPFLKGWQIQ